MEMIYINFGTVLTQGIRGSQKVGCVGNVSLAPITEIYNDYFTDPLTFDSSTLHFSLALYSMCPW